MIISLYIGDIDRVSVYVSLALGMEQPVGVDPPMENVACCYQYTSSDDDGDQVAPTMYVLIKELNCLF